MEKRKFRHIDKTHKYYLDGEIIPSVTDIRKCDYPIHEFYLWRGKFIHDCCDLLLLGNLDLNLLRKDDRKRVSKFLKFLYDYGLYGKKATVKKGFYHPVFEYGFKPDAHFKKEKVLVEIKNGGFSIAYLTQVIAYWEGLEANGIQINKAYLVLLHPDRRLIVNEVRRDKLIYRQFLSDLKNFKKEKENDRNKKD